MGNLDRGTLFSQLFSTVLVRLLYYVTPGSSQPYSPSITNLANTTAAAAVARL